MGVLELVLVFGLVIAWAIWELIKLRRDKAGADRRDRER